jgi:hypothetical protein
VLGFRRRQQGPPLRDVRDRGRLLPIVGFYSTRPPLQVDLVRDVYFFGKERQKECKDEKIFRVSFPV